MQKADFILPTVFHIDPEKLSVQSNRHVNAVIRILVNSFLNKYIVVRIIRFSSQLLAIKLDNQKTFTFA